MFRSYGAFGGGGNGVTTAADTYGALAVAWILPTADAAWLRGALGGGADTGVVADAINRVPTEAQVRWTGHFKSDLNLDIL